MVWFFENEEAKTLSFPEGALRKKYALTNMGRIISFTDKIEEGDFLKGGTLQGYKTLPVRPFGDSKTFYVHKLIAQLFIPKQEGDGDIVIHKDYDKQNNNVDNLAWVDNRGNMTHQQNNPNVIAGRKKMRNRKTKKGHKLTDNQVIRLKMAIWNPKRKTRLKMIARQFGISEMQLYRIKNGENWAHVKVKVNNIWR